MGRSEGKGEEERAEEMSDEPPGINQTLLKGSTQPCWSRAFHQHSFKRAGVSTGGERRRTQLSMPASHSCAPAPLPVLLQTPQAPDEMGSLSLSLSPLPVSKARRVKPTLPFPFLGFTPIPGSREPCAASCPLLRSAWGAVGQAGVEGGGCGMWGAGGWRRQGKGRDCGGRPGREPRGGDMQGTWQREAQGWGPRGDPRAGGLEHSV